MLPCPEFSALYFLLPLSVRDARKIGYAEYGKLDGEAVLYFHGTPGSRMLPDSDAATAKRAGLRVIVLERPGYGLSDYRPGGRLLDWPDDVNQVADALGITHFGVVSVSGGGPYAVACAYKILSA